MNKLKEIHSLSNRELLDLYTAFVKIHHYDPHETPKCIKELYKEKLTPDDLYDIILERMFLEKTDD